MDPCTVRRHVCNLARRSLEARREDAAQADAALALLHCRSLSSSTCDLSNDRSALVDGMSEE